MTYPATAQVRSGYGPRRRRRGLLIVPLVLVIIVGLLVIADYAARAYAENRIASEIHQQGFPQKPSVTIDGFPFLTQAASRDFSEIQITAGPLTTGPLQIQGINLVMNGVHVDSSYKGGTVDHLTATLSVTFAALSSAMTSQAGDILSDIGGGFTLSPAGPDEVKATLSMPVVGSETEVWKVSTPPGSDELNLHLVSGNGGLLPQDWLNALGDVNLPVQQLPFGLSIKSISVTAAGVTGVFTGTNTQFGS